MVSEVGSHRSHKIPGHGYQPTVSTESDEEDASQARDRINELFKTTNISSSNFPSSPVPPTKPAFVPHENDRSRLILPREKWDGYVEEMNRYITEWGDFQKTMFKLLLCDHEKARKHWSLEFEKHQQCVVQLGEVRECIRTNGVIIWVKTQWVYRYIRHWLRFIHFLMDCVPLSWHYSLGVALQ